MNQSNNKKRLLALIEILKKNSDNNKHLSLNEIIYYLEKKNINVNNRKTLYDDFKVLNDFNINIEYDNGYYLLDAPFNLSEIKIILDSINSLKNLDTRLLNDLNNKLLSFISNDEEKLLNSISYSSNHSDTKLLQHMEDILFSISRNTSILVKTKNNTNEVEIYPVFLYRQNDYYYIYYHYPNVDKIYHYRFDSIKSINVTNNKDSICINKKTIIKHIQSSSNTFNTGKSELVEIKLNNNNENLILRILDDFPNAIKTKDGFSIIANLNNIFYSKICAYGNNLTITTKKVAIGYLEYLKSIINNY